MSAPQFGERIPVKHGIRVFAHLRLFHGYPMSVWELIAAVLDAEIESTEGVSDFSRTDLTPMGSVLGLSVSIKFRATFHSTMDDDDVARLKRRIAVLLAPYGVKHPPVELVPLGSF